MADSDPDPNSFLGKSGQARADNTPMPKLTAPPPPNIIQNSPASSAGSGALPPSAAPASSPPSSDAGAVSFSVVSDPKTGGHTAYGTDADGAPQKLFDVRLPEADVKAVLDASGARFDAGLKSYENVPEETVKALGQGRPTAPDYWQQQWGASEAEAVRNFNGLQFLSGAKTAAQTLSDNHLPTLKMQLADRPDMAWFGKGGIVSDFLKNPSMEPIERGAESVVGSLAKQIAPIMDAATRALAVGSGAGLAVGAVAPPLALPAFGVGAEVGVMYSLKDMMKGQVAADGLEQGLPEDLIREKANAAGAISAAIMVPGFAGMSLLGKSAFLDELASSAAAKRAIAHMAVGGVAGGSVMAAQQAVTEILNHMVAEAASRPDLLEDPKNALKNILMAGLGGAAFGAGAVVFAEGMRKAFDALDKEVKSSPEGKKVSASIKRAEDPSVHDAMERHLNPPPAPLELEAEKANPASGQSALEKPGGSPGQTPSASEQPSRDLTPSTQEEPSTSNSSSSGKESIPHDVGELKASKKLIDTNRRDYVPHPDFGAIPKTTMKAAAREVLQRYSEVLNGWLVRGAHLVDDLKTSAPEAEQPGITWYLAAQGDEAKLREWRSDPTLESIHDALDTALKLSDESKANVEKLQRFYAEWEAEAKTNEVLKNGIENFQARYWQKVGEEEEKPKWDWRSPFKQTTGHAKERVFQSEVEAIRAGYLPRMSAYDAAGVYSEEMSAVNANRLTANNLVEQGLAKWTQEPPAAGEARFGELEKQKAITLADGGAGILRYHLQGPEELADGVRAITEPDWTKRIPVLKGAGRVQGIIKTGNLAWSAFHPITLAAQGAATGNWANLFSRDLDAGMATPEFAAQEAVAVDHGVVTSEIAANQDIQRHLVEEEGPLSTVTNLPGVKPLLSATEKMSDWIFGKQQRFYKVTDFTRIFGDWREEHPDADAEASKAAGREIGRFVNATYGSLNWTAMGMMKATSSIFRSLILAPDWLTSSASMVKMATTERGLGGDLARGYFARAALLGTAALVGGNELTTGHSPLDNPKGHKLDVEIAPNVWFTPFRGPMGEVTKLGSLMEERGLPGAAQYGANKAAPLPRLAMSAGLNTLYSGRPIVPSRAPAPPHINPETGRTIKTRPVGPVEGSYDFMKWLLTSLTPTPFGLASLSEYLKNEKEPTFLGAFTVGAGITRYAPAGGKSKKTGHGGARDTSHDAADAAAMNVHGD